MARAYDDPGSLRFGRRESERLIVALLVSLLLHVTLWTCYHTGEKRGWWQKWHAPVWLNPVAKKFPLQPKTAAPEDPTIFVDVSHADADAPQRPKFYSNRNSHAANPEVANTDAPKIDGHQTFMPKAEDVPKAVKGATVAPPAPPQEAANQASKADAAAQFSQLQPARPAPPSAEPADAPQTPGETELLRPEKNAAQLTATAAVQPHPDRPRTLKEALARRDQIPGQQMQQAGGVLRRAPVAFDAKGTPFGEYDAAIVEAVSQRWYDLLDSRRFAQDRNGKVMLRFKLKSDGSVIEVQTLENTVGDLLGYLCQEAIEEAAPFAKWPPDMVRMIGSNYREVTFTFYYY